MLELKKKKIQHIQQVFDCTEGEMKDSIYNVSLSLSLMLLLYQEPLQTLIITDYVQVNGFVIELDHLLSAVWELVEVAVKKVTADKRHWGEKTSTITFLKTQTENTKTSVGSSITTGWKLGNYHRINQLSSSLGQFI